MNSKVSEGKSGEAVLRVLDPTGVKVAGRRSLARPLDTLEGKRIGLVWNQKPGADLLLDEVGKLLQKRYPTVKISNWTKEVAWAPPAGTLERIAEEVDAAIVASGD